MSNPLATYLNDHLAGSNVALDLAERASREHAGTPLGAFLSQLAGDIREDRKALELVMAAAGADREEPKLKLSWLQSQLSRLKLDDRLLRRSNPSTLLQLETLELGITGKELLWRALSALNDPPQPAGTDYAELIMRARTQRDAVETQREAIASTELGR